MTNSRNVRPADLSTSHPAFRWLDEHLGISAFDYVVPAHANKIWYLLGGVSVIGLLVLIATGIWLAQFYHPHPSQAYSSVVYIVTRAPLGGFIRGLHYWAANIVVATVLLHMSRVFLTASYKHPREINWFVGVGLLALMFGFIFTGTVLKWDQEGYEALGHEMEIAEMLGRFGGWFSPQFTESVPLLIRLYITHVSILPLLLLILLLVHFFQIRHYGISPPTNLEGQPYNPKLGTETFGLHLRRMLGYGLLIFIAATGLLSFVRPAPLGKPPIPGIEIKSLPGCSTGYMLLRTGGD